MLLTDGKFLAENRNLFIREWELITEPDIPYRKIDQDISDNGVRGRFWDYPRIVYVIIVEICCIIGVLQGHNLQFFEVVDAARYTDTNEILFHICV